MNPKEVSKFPLWSDDWWIEDAQKRVDKIKKRMRSMNPYTMSQKDYSAKLRMLNRAQETLYYAIEKKLNKVMRD